MLVGLGIALRLVQYLSNLSYFHDEICLLWNIRDKTIGQYAGPLDRNQAAPPLFMILERALLHLFGEREMVMRIPALAASCLTIVLFSKLSRRILSPWGAVAALWLVICSGELLSHGALLKPYALDAMFAVALSLGAIACQHDRRGARRWWLFCASAAVAVWISYPVILIFAGLSLALLPDVAGRPRGGWIVYAAGNLLVGLSFLTLMKLVEGSQHTRYMTEAWDKSFLHLSRPRQTPLWLYNALFNLTNRSWKPGGVIALPLSLIGIVALALGKHRMLAIVIGPMMMNLITAAAGKYPFDSERLTLYLLPAVCILISAGAAAICHLPGPRWRFVGLIPGVAILAFASLAAARNALHPPALTYYRPAISYVRARAQSGDVVYSPFDAEFEYYWPEIGDRIRVNVDYADAIPSRRFWIVWSNPTRSDKIKMEKQRTWARTFATEIDAHHEGDNYIYLYEMSPRRPPHTVEPMTPR